MFLKGPLLVLTMIPVVQSFARGMLAGRNTARPLIRKFCSSGASATPTAEPAKKSPDPIELLEIRVGKIIEIGKHPEGDSLYVEKVDVGEPAGPRTIVSGLVEYCTTDYLLNKNVVVLCNLKPRALKGVVSEGMLLCTSNKAAGKVRSPFQNWVYVHQHAFIRIDSLNRWIH